MNLFRRTVPKNVNIMLFIALLLVCILMLMSQSHFMSARKNLVNQFPKQCPPGELCISFGTSLFGDWKTWLSYSNYWQEKCVKTSNCTLILDYSQASAVIFHSRDLAPAKKNSRDSKQHWIYLSWETPINVQHSGYNIFADSYWSKQFNLTATYDRDADIVLPYAWLEPLTEQEIDEMNEQPLYDAAKKKKMAYAVISNCNTLSKREEYLKELANYISLDVYGHCGKKILPPGHGTIGTLANEYRFYLSFENSYCKDYITEKFWWNGMKYPIVPVVMGGESRLDYERVAPRDSFIHVNDFPNVLALANHLKLIAANETLYAKHLEWKREKKVTDVDKGQDLICKVCEYLHSEKALRKHTTDVAQIWGPKRKCFNY